MGHGLEWESTPNGMRVVGPWQFAMEQKNRLQDRNPYWLQLVPIYHYGAHPENYPEDWPYWLRDESGNRIADEGWGELLIDYTHPAAQDHFVQQAIAVAKCGLFDGIFMDWWTQEEDSNLEIAHLYHGNRISAEVSMLRRIREAVGDDFLIVVNSRTEEIPLSAPYVNGAFMEGHRRHTREYLAEVESTLLWAEANFRFPQVNGYEAWSILEEPLNSPRNQQWMRVFTTLSLTHSNGYVSYVIGFDGALKHQHGYEVWEGHAAEHAAGEVHEHTHEKSWHAFWDAPLGRPLAETRPRASCTAVGRGCSSASSRMGGRCTTGVEACSRSSCRRSATGSAQRHHGHTALARGSGRGDLHQRRSQRRLMRRGRRLCVTALTPRGTGRSCGERLWSTLR